MFACPVSVASTGWVPRVGGAAKLTSVRGWNPGGWNPGGGDNVVQMCVMSAASHCRSTPGTQAVVRWYNTFAGKKKVSNYSSANNTYTYARAHTHTPTHT